ncbi:VWA domain-containing protein [Candidatus Saccharibacteria bacterium]|nr:VWA domain-containing protein [Candidatus Saccharibacteria bacterium]
MSEVLRTVVQNAPYVGAAAGYASMLVAERNIVKHAAQERQPLNEIIGETIEQSQNPSIKDRINKFVGPLAVAGAIAGGMVGMAFQEEGKVKTNTNLQMVVDRSGGTRAEVSDGTAADSVNEILEEFASHNETSADVFVAQGGRVSKANYQKVINEVRPIGGAPMQDAVEQAISNVASTKLEGDNTKNAVVVLTNGNSFGEPDSVIRKARKADVSVFIKNIDASSSDSKSMNKISEKTGGQYMTESDDPEKLYEQVKDKSSGQELRQAPDSKHDIPEKVLSVLLAGGILGAVGRARRKMPLTFNGSDIK